MEAFWDYFFKKYTKIPVEVSSIDDSRDEFFRMIEEQEEALKQRGRRSKKRRKQQRQICTSLGGLHHLHQYITNLLVWIIKYQLKIIERGSLVHYKIQLKSEILPIRACIKQLITISSYGRQQLYYTNASPIQCSCIDKHHFMELKSFSVCFPWVFAKLILKLYDLYLNVLL